MAEPYRILDLGVFVGDAWATRAGQAVPPANVPRLVMPDDTPFRVKVIPVDAPNANANQVVDTGTTIDFRVVKIHRNPSNVEQTELLESIVENTGNEQQVGGGFSEVDVDTRDVLVAAFPTITLGPAPAAALLIYVLRPQEAT